MDLQDAPPAARATQRGMRDSLRLLIISDTRLVRDALAASLGNEPGLQLVGAVASGEAVAAATGLSPNAAVIDAGVAGGAGFLRQLKRALADLHVVVCGASDSDAELVEWFRAGAVGCCSRDDGPAELASAIRRAAAGELVCTPRLAAVLISRVAQPAARQSPHRHALGLTGRELEIGLLLQGGHSNKEMARHLRISEATVKNHVHNILEKLQVRSRWQAAARLGTLAAETGSRVP